MEESETIEESIISSAKNFAEDFILVSRSLMYMRKRSGPRTDPWGTPDSIGAHSE